MTAESPALDFLRKVEVWQQAPGGTAGIAVAMPAGDEQTLDQLLADFRRRGSNTQLEAQARIWLIGYREMSPPLTDNQRAELDAVVAGLPEKSGKVYTENTRLAHHLAVVAIVTLVVIAFAVGTPAIWSAMHPGKPVQQGSQSQEHPPPEQVPPGSTDLQNFKADWGPWRQLPVSQQNPQSGAPALLFLEQGGYYASQAWTVPANVAAWISDLGGNIQGVDVQGSHALITDADGNSWTVAVNQSFVLARNPGTVLKIDPTGTVYAIPEAHAIGLRRYI